MKGDATAATAGQPAATPADPVVLKLLAAQRVHALYPRNSPNVRVAVGKLREAVVSFPGEDGLRLDVEREHLKHSDVPVLPTSAEVRDLANRLYLAHVEAIPFSRELTDDEILALFDLFKLKGDERGHFDEELPARGVAGIVVREAGRVKIIEGGEVDPDSWDLGAVAELEDLDSRILGDASRSELKAALRTVAAGTNLKTARLIALLERPPDFASLLVELASRVRPRERTYLNAQVILVEALVKQMESVLEKLPEVDQMHLYSKLDEVIAILAGAFHSGLLTLTAPPFVRVGGIGELFSATPHGLREMTLEEALGNGLRPRAGLATALLGGLRLMERGPGPLHDYFAPALPPAAPDPELLAHYRPTPPGPPPPPARPADELRVPPDDLASAAERDLAAAVRAGNGMFDSLPSLVDLLAGETDPALVRPLLDQLVDRFALALDLRNIEMAAAALGSIHAERMIKAGQPAVVQLLDHALARCAEPPMMRALAALVADLPSGGDEQRKVADLVRELPENAVISLLDILGGEALQSTRRKLLDLLAALVPAHLDLISSYSSHPQWYVVRNVVWLLGRGGAPALAVIRKLSTHREPRVRREAVRSLALIGGAEALRGITGYLLDKDEAVFREATAKLVALRAEEAVPALHAALQSPAFAEREAESILGIARALAALGSTASAQLLDQVAEARVARGWLKAPEVKRALQAAAAQVRERVGTGGR